MKSFFSRFFSPSRKKPNPPRSRKLTIESLENRELLTVSSAEFSVLRSTYSELELGDQEDYNIIEILSNELSDVKLREVFAGLEESYEDNLIVVRTTATNNRIQMTEGPLVLSESLNGSVCIVSLGNSRLTIDSRQSNHILEITNSTDFVLGGVVLGSGHNVALNMEGGLLHATKSTIYGAVIAADVQCSHLTIQGTVELVGTMFCSQGLTLNGTLRLSEGSLLVFKESQSISGTGTLVLDSSMVQLEGFSEDSVILTVAQGITIRSESGEFEESSISAWGSKILNQGKIINTSGSFILEVEIENRGTIELEGGMMVLSMENLNNQNGKILHSSGTFDFTSTLVDGGRLESTDQLNLESYFYANGLTIAGKVGLSGSLTITGGLNLEGELRICSGGEIVFAGTQVLSGTGNLVFDASDAGVSMSLESLEEDSSPELTLSKTMKVRAIAAKDPEDEDENLNEIHFHSWEGRLVNLGTITGTSGTLVFDLPFENRNLVESDGGILAVFNELENLGTFHAKTGTITFQGEIRNSSGIISAGEGYVGFENDSILRGGILRKTETGLIEISSATFEGITLETDLGITGQLNIVSGLNLNRTIRVSNGGVLNFSGSQSLEGTGTILLDSSESTCSLSVVGEEEEPVEFRIGEGILISSIGTGDSESLFEALEASVLNFGRIESLSGTLLLSLSFENHGIIETLGGSISIGNEIVNHGVLSSRGGTFSILQSVENFEGIVSSTGGEMVFENDSVIRGGTLLGDGGTFVANEALFHGMLFEGEIPLAGSFAISGGLTLNGTLRSTSENFVFRESQHFGGTGTVVLESSRIQLEGRNESQCVLTIGESLTISAHSGTDSSSFLSGDSGKILNYGTITVFSGALSLEVEVENRGVLESHGGILSFERSLGNYEGLILHTSGELRFDSQETSLRGGVLRSSGILKIENDPIFESICIEGIVDLTGELRIIGGLDLHGEIHVHQSGNLTFLGSQRLEGPGSIFLDSGPEAPEEQGSVFFCVEGSTDSRAELVIMDSILITISGPEDSDSYISIDANEGSFNNFGTIRNHSGRTRISDYFINNGTVESEGGVLSIRGRFENSGGIIQLLGGVLEFLDGTLSGGIVQGESSVFFTGDNTVKYVRFEIEERIENRGTLTLINSVISGREKNGTRVPGGGILNTDTLLIVNSTITGNKDFGVFNEGELNLYNTIIVENGEDILSENGTVQGQGNLSSFNGWEESREEINFLYQPELPLFTDADSGDFSLDRGSQAVDRGLDEIAQMYALDSNGFDLRGKTRVSGSRIDIGAYELSFFNSSQTGVYTEEVKFSWIQYENTDSVRFTWISGIESRELGVFPSEGNFTWNTRLFPDQSGRLKIEFLDSQGRTLMGFDHFGSIINDETIVIHRGSITAREIWDPEKIHLVVGTLAIPGGTSLEIGENAIVKFWKEASIHVELNGSLSVRKNSVLTRAEDDLIGGDSNKDAGRSLPSFARSYFHGQGQFDISDQAQIKYQEMERSGFVSTNEIWKGDQVYHITETIIVPSGTTLQILPGAILKFDPGCSLIAEEGGVLIAEGFENSPIVFTSIRDDDYGGDSNEDGRRTTPHAGDWDRILCKGGEIVLQHVRISYSGNLEGEGALQLRGGTVVLKNSVVEHSKGESVKILEGNFSATNSILRKSPTAIGLYCDSFSNTEFINCVIDDVEIAIRGSGVVLENSFVNTVFSRISGNFFIPESFSDLSGYFRNCAFWNPAEMGPQSFSATGKNGNIWADPLFRNSSAGDYRILAGSPLIDAGDGTRAPSEDKSGVSRENDFHIIEKAGIPDECGVYADIGVYEFINSSNSFMDLQPVDILVPDTISPGEEITIQWTIRNNGSVPVEGSWRDRIVLISDSGEVVPASEILHSGRIGVDAVQSFQLRITIPLLYEGFWKFAVQCNTQGDVFEGTMGANNDFTSPVSTEVEVPPLQENHLEIDLDSRESRLFKVVIPRGESLFIVANSSQRISLQISRDRVPTELSHDDSAFSDGFGRYALSVAPDSGEDRVFYLCVRSESFIENATVSISISKDTFQILSTDTKELLNSGSGTIRILGAGFDSTMSVSLVQGSRTIIGTRLNVISGSCASIRFPLEGVDAGFYDLVLHQNGQSTLLKDAIRITTGDTSPNLRAHLELPDHVLSGDVYQGYVVFENTGNCDILAPVFTLRSKTGTPIGVHPDSLDVSENGIRFIGWGSQGSEDVLRPGEIQKIPFYFQAGEDTNFELSCRWEDRSEEPIFENPGFGEPSQSSAMDEKSPENLSGDVSNTIYGPVDYESREDSTVWIAGNHAVDYRIYFESPGTLSPVREMVVITRLSPHWDWDSIEPSEIQIGSEVFVMDSKTGENSWLVHQNSTGEQLLISFTIDVSSEKAIWSIRSFSASTYDHFPADGYQGFLFPGDEFSPDRGHLGFRVQLKNQLETGTVLESSASITYDSRVCVSTNVCSSTLDADAPQSRVAELPSTTDREQITVQWSGTDLGSGLAFYDIYVSVDGAPFERWIENTAETSAVFTGENGKTYGFLSVATDQVGLREPLRSGADTTVSVRIGKAPSKPSGFRAESGSSSNITLNWNAASDAEFYLIEFSTDNQNWTILQSQWKGNSCDHSGLQVDTTYYYRLTAENSYGNSPSATTSMRTNEEQKPIAVIDHASMLSVQQGCSLQIRASGSVDPLGEGLKYFWDLRGDGIFVEFPGNTVWFSNDLLIDKTQDSHAIQMFVRDAEGKESEIVSAVIRIESTAPTFHVQSPQSQQLISRKTTYWDFSVSTEDYKSIVGWIIDWGDGSENTTYLGGPRSTISLDHYFRNPGQYAITITMIDVHSQTNSIQIGPFLVEESLATLNSILQREFPIPGNFETEFQWSEFSTDSTSTLHVAEESPISETFLRATVSGEIRSEERLRNFLPFFLESDFLVRFPEFDAQVMQMLEQGLFDGIPKSSSKELLRDFIFAREGLFEEEYSLFSGNEGEEQHGEIPEEGFDFIFR